MLCLKLDHRRH